MATASTAAVASDESVSTLMALGFDRHDVVAALQSTGGNVERAANVLLSPPPMQTVPTSSPPTSSTATMIVQGSISQYDLPNGQSACSCIALAVAAHFLQAQQTDSSTATAILQPAFLDTAVRKGHELYSLHHQQQGSHHTSPDDMLPLFPTLQVEGGIRQGILKDASTWYSMLNDGQTTAFVITKPPETICVLVSPEGCCWLIDSHSRPPLTTAASAMCFDSLFGLCQALTELFPATVISDVPDTMLLMYNSFDLYPLRFVPAEK